MLSTDAELAALIDAVPAGEIATEAEMIEALAYGNLKMEMPSLERSTVAAAMRSCPPLPSGK